jgi:stress response protein YsnF
MVVNNSEFIDNKSRINNLLEKLRKKLSGFEVINLKGQTLGILSDFTLDKSRRLYMVIPQLESEADSPAYLLSSKYIQKVDASNRALFVDISLTKFHQLPLYLASKDKTAEFSEHYSAAPETQANLTSSSEVQTLDETEPLKVQSFTTNQHEEVDNQELTESENQPEVVEEKTIRLLEERLLINRSKRKIGEVVVRKEVETRIIEVPIQSEKLVVDKFGAESKQPVEIEPVSVDQISHDRGTELSGHSPTPPATQVSITSSRRNTDADDDTLEVVEEEIICLLEERLVVNRSKWKVGEVVVRKEVENKIVQVPIRREKLIIEQISPETKQIAEIDLGKGEVSGIELTEASTSDTLDRSAQRADNPYTVIGEFLSPKAASHLLEAIALQGQHGCKKVRVELVLDNPELQQTYQGMFDRCSTH